MPRRPILVLCGLIAVLALGFTGLWFLTRKPALQALEQGQALADPAVPLEKPPEGTAIESSVEAGAPERHAVEKAAPAKKSAGAAALTPLEAELKNALWVDGKLRFPDGTPPDEKIAIEARGKKFSNDALHSAEVGRDGSYRVAFAAGTRTGWLRVKGRYAYLAEDHKVKLPTKAGAVLEPVELVPLLGGWIRGRVTLPLGVSSEGAGLAGTRVQAWCMQFFSGDEQDSRRNLSGEIDADGRFEIGGVPGKSGWSLSIDPESFTRAHKGDVKVDAGKAVDLEIPLRSGARLAGQVVDEDGAPVAEATFSYQAPNNPGDSWTNFHGRKTAADGRFDLRGAPAAKGTLSVEKSGYLPGRETFHSLAEGGAQQGLRIVMQRGNAISGTVLWPDGQPVVGAMVALDFTPEKPDENQSFTIFGSDGQSTKSDSAGNFRFTGLARGTATLRAEAKPPAGKPGADAKAVEASAGEDEKPDAPAADEAAEAKKPAPKSLKVRKWTAVVEDVQAGTQDLRLAIDAGYSIQGRVVDSAGEPLKEFLVRAEPVDKDRKDWEPLRGALTGRFSDAGGRFVLEGLHQGEWKIRAEAKNAPACAPQQIRVPGQDSPLELVLASACTISGVVVDPKGQPVRSARVRANPERDESRSFVFNANKKFSASSDPEGKFSISGIPPGPLTLHATSDEWAAPEPQAFDLGPGQKQENVRVVLRTPGKILGLVLDRAGRTDGGRPISLSGGASGGWQQTTSDSNGRFSFEKLSPGDYTLHTQAKQEEYAAAGDDQNRWNRVWQEQQRTLSVTVAEGAASEVTLGGLPKDAIHLVGRVTCAGRPVANAFLQALRRGEEDESDEPRNFHASAADDGSFDLVLGGAGTYDIHVNADGSGTSTSIRFEVAVSAQAQQPRDFELPGARIAGRVVDPAGKVQAQVWLQLSPDHRARGDRGRGVSGSVTSDEQGRFAFEHVAPGTYEIACGGMEHGWSQTARTGRTTRSGLVVEPGKSLEGLEIVAQPACRVEGTVTGPDGAPVAGAIVVVVDEQGKSLLAWQREVTDATGRFDFDALPPGRAAFLAQKGSLTSGFSVWVQVQEREASKVELALVNGTVIFVETATADGSHVNADIQVFDSRGLDVSQASAGAAAPVETLPGWRFGPLPPGKYTAVVMRKDKPDLHQDISVGGEPAQAVKVQCD